MNVNILNNPAASEIYQMVLDKFHFSRKEDLAARDLLFDLRIGTDPIPLLRELEQKLKVMQPIFIGAGPLVKTHLNQIKETIIQNRNNILLIAADGAARVLQEVGLGPDVIVTDLDGISKQRFDIFCHQNVIMCVHAHGDNQAKLREFSDIIRNYPRIIATTQTEPKFPVINPGGFTDGDRGVFLCHFLSPPFQTYIFVGYEFGDLIGEYSKEEFTHPQPMTPTKKMKLEICKKLLQDFPVRSYRKTLFYDSGAGIDAEVFKLISILNEYSQ